MHPVRCRSRSFALGLASFFVLPLGRDSRMEDRVIPRVISASAYIANSAISLIDSVSPPLAPGASGDLAIQIDYALARIGRPRPGHARNPAARCINPCSGRCA